MWIDGVNATHRRDHHNGAGRQASPDASTPARSSFSLASSLKLTLAGITYCKVSLVRDQHQHMSRHASILTCIYTLSTPTVGLLCFQQQESYHKLCFRSPYKL